MRASHKLWQLCASVFPLVAWTIQFFIHQFSCASTVVKACQLNSSLPLVCEFLSSHCADIVIRRGKTANVFSRLSITLSAEHLNTACQKDKQSCFFIAYWNSQTAARVYHAWQTLFFKKMLFFFLFSFLCAQCIHTVSISNCWLTSYVSCLELVFTWRL